MLTLFNKSDRLALNRQGNRDLKENISYRKSLSSKSSNALELITESLKQ